MTAALSWLSWFRLVCAALLAVMAYVPDTHRSRRVDQQPEHAASGRECTDRPTSLGIDAGCDELDQDVALANHAERSVPGVGDVRREVDDALQDDRQRKLGGE